MKVNLVVSVVLALFSIGCVGAASYALPLEGRDPTTLLEPLAVCASDAGMSIARHDESTNVQFRDGAWIQFMVKEANRLDMVVVLTQPVDKDREGALMDAARVRGNELHACARQRAPGRTGMTGRSLEGDRCVKDAHCPSGACAGGRCQDRQVGARCTKDAHCQSGACARGECQDRGRGARCIKDAHCDSAACVGGACN